MSFTPSVMGGDHYHNVVVIDDIRVVDVCADGVKGIDQMSEQAILAELEEIEKMAERVLPNVRQFCDAYRRGQHYQSITHAEIAASLLSQLTNKTNHLFGLAEGGK